MKIFNKPSALDKINTVAPGADNTMTIPKIPRDMPSGPMNVIQFIHEAVPARLKDIEKEVASLQAKLQTLETERATLKKHFDLIPNGNL